MKATNLNKTVLGALVALTALGCTEERPYEQISKVNETYASKSAMCDSDAKYLYLPSTVEASRTTTATRPHWMGDAKVVNLVCDQHSIKVVDLDVANDEFGDNPANKRTVLTIPITHGDIKCDENADGKCSNKEIFDQTVTWTKAKDIRLEMSQMQVQEVNFLPEQLTNLFQPSCLNELSTEPVKSVVESDTNGVTAVNLTLQRNYQTSIRCARGLRSLADLGFSVRNHYSIVRLDTIADPNYKPLKYTRAEETTFGFFDTKSNKLDVDNNEIAANEKAFVNRWNPNKEIVYHMNKDFLKPENQQLIQPTKDAIAKINEGLASVGAKMQIKLLEPDTTGELMTGDIRVNSIVLEDDPLAMNVIGYGPSAANPYTGEILHGRTVMYLGTIRKFVKRTYDEFVSKKIAEIAALAKKEEAEKSEVKEGDDSEEKQEVSVADSLTAQALFHRAALDVHSNYVMEKTNGQANIRQIASTPAGHSFLPVTDELLKKVATDRKSHVFRSIFDMPEQTAEEFLMHKNCQFTTDMLGADLGIDEQIDELVTKLEVKPWIQLTAEQKQEVLDLLTPFVWTPVLVHEIGHNLGLRHNFAGSEDKANFYTKDELIEKGLTREITYSSVMDYSYSTINELPILGKYDLAALRFGYAEAVEMNDGSIKPLEIFRAEGGELKPYDFCTDEHVALNPNCNRFDEGSSLLEITQHNIKAHQEGYLRNNFRNGKRDFSLMDDLSYASRINRSLGGMRLVFERYENIKNTFGLADDAAEWESIEFLKDLKDSVKLSASYLASIITTPDLMCAVSQASNPFQIVALVPINQLSTNAASCYDTQNVRLNPQFMIVGHAGKLFQSKKDPRNSNPYIDQIDVRGVWIDKLVALNMLTGREQGISSFDKFRDNFLDIADVAQGVDSVLKAITTNQVVAPVTIQTVFGQALTVDFPVNMYDVSEQNNGHRIMKPLSPVTARYFNLPDGNPTFQKVAINNIKKNVYSEDQFNNPSSLFNALDAFVVDIGVQPPPARDGFVNTNIGTRVYAAPGTSSVAATAIVSHDLAKVLEAMGPELIAKVLADIEAGKGPAEDASELEKTAHQLGAEILMAFQNGVIQPSKFYAQTVKVMAQ